MQNYDYASQGAYFVTICTHEKQTLFGSIEDGSLKLNLYGETVASCWKDIPLHYPEINNSVFIVMPNHVHGIVMLAKVDGRAGSKPAPTKEYPLSEIIRAFKTYSSRRINEQRNSQGTPMWQRGFYEHVIRGESDFLQISEYIMFNSKKWETDRENPNVKMKISPLSF